MNNMITSNLKGGLGNFLFQISTSFAYSKKYKKNLIFNSSSAYIVHQNIEHYKDNIFSKLPFKKDIQRYDTSYIEQSFEYNEIPFFNGSVYLDGYFQSEKYFLNFRNDILDLFDIGEINKSIINEKYSDLIKKNTCSIHVRRGDYLNYPDIHPTLSLDYYKQSVSHFNNDVTFLVFSDDIKWCKENLKTLSDKFIYIEGNTDFQDLYLMSMCNNNIIANSTFSWWGAWLNKHKNKIVVSPKKWFGSENNQYNTDDLYCEGWLII